MMPGGRPKGGFAGVSETRCVRHPRAPTTREIWLGMKVLVVSRADESCGDAGVSAGESCECW